MYFIFFLYDDFHRVEIQWLQRFYLFTSLTPALCACNLPDVCLSFDLTFEKLNPV